MDLKFKVFHFLGTCMVKLRLISEERLFWTEMWILAGEGARRMEKVRKW